MEDIKYEGICYVLVQTNEIHPITHKRHDLLWYPERGMSLVDQIGYWPYVQSIVTENPWLIATYDRESVRVWDKERGWVCPNEQTYGASVNSIMMRVLGFRNTIPAQIIDGGKEHNEKVKEIEESYKDK